MKIPCRKFWLSLIVQPVALVATLAHAGTDNPGQCERVVAVESYASAGIAPAGSACNTFLGLSADTGVSCYWEFSFRNDAAVQLADALWSEITDCRAGTRSEPDLPVNHPDSYDLKELIAGRDVYRVSVKDKGAQNRTLVFIRFERLSEGRSD